MLTSQPIFSRPVQWILGVLSWLAFGIAAYLALHTLSNTSVAGCGVGSHNGCDVVLNSAWSKWLGVPVAILGLACYASLATLSVLLAFQSHASRWITTAFVLFSALAAGASVWFIAVQVFAIGDICWYCLATDLCGIGIGAIAAWSVFRSWPGGAQRQSSGSSAASLSALRGAIPSNSRLAPVAATRTAQSVGTSETLPPSPPKPPAARARSVPVVGSVAASPSRRRFDARPSVPIAYGGALALLLILIGGQVVFPAKTFELEKGELNADVDLSANKGNQISKGPSDGIEPHVAMRPETNGETEPTDAKLDPAAATSGNGGDAPNDSKNSADASVSSSEAPPQPKRERIIKLLGGKLTLNVADEPIIGSVNAPHVVVEMISYDCSHCRKTNSYVKRALSRYGDQVALVVLILPIEASCNKLITDPSASHAGACSTARTAIALSKLNPNSFPQFHNYLMSGDEKKPPSSTSTLTKSFGMADRDKLLAMRDSKDVAEKIASYIELYESLRVQSSKSKKEFGLPIQILGDHIMSGTVKKADDIYKAWEEHLGVKPR